MAEQNVRWPQDAEKLEDSQIKGNTPLMASDVSDEDKLAYITHDQLADSVSKLIEIKGIEVKPIAGGATSATAVVLPAGPAGEVRKMTGVTGWFKNTSSGTPWEAPVNYDNTNWWDGTTWSLGSSVALPMQQGVAIINPVGTDLTQEKAVADYVQPLFDTISALEDKIDELTESKEALIIDNIIPTIGSNTTSNPKTEIIVTGTSGATLTGDFSAWGATINFPATVKYVDGTYENIHILSFTATEAICEKSLSKNVERISNIHDVALGQHLSDLGFKEMGYRLYNSDYRHSFRQTLVKEINMSHHTYSGGIISDSVTSKQVLKIRALGGYPLTFIGISGQSVNYTIANTPRMDVFRTAVVGQGFEFDFDSNYNGWYELFIGTNITTNSCVGACKVELVNRVDNSVIKEYTVKGSVRRLLFDHGTGRFTIRITVPVAELTDIKVSQMYWWKKRNISAQKIFNKNDKILFLTDSWGMYPVESDPNFQVQMFDGHKINGRCNMPIEFKNRFVADGGNPDNIVLATRGGMTTVWAKYWIDYIVNIVKPTKIVFHFGINDSNSITFHSNPENAYKFDPNNIWGVKDISAGGKVGSIPDKATYAANILDLKNYCISKGIIPIFFTTPKTASSGQAQELSNLARDVFFKGLK